MSAYAAALGGGGVLCVGAAARREGSAPLLVYAATRSAVACADVASAAPRVQQLDTHGATGAKAAAMSEHGEFILGAWPQMSECLKGHGGWAESRRSDSRCSR